MNDDDALQGLGSDQRRAIRRALEEHAEPEPTRDDAAMLMSQHTTTAARSASELYDRRELRVQLCRAITTLKPRERQVLSRRFFLDMVLEEVGATLPLISPTRDSGKHPTRERVRQIEAKGLRKMRHPLRTKHLTAFVAHNDPCRPEGTWLSPPGKRTNWDPRPPPPVLGYAATPDDVAPWFHTLDPDVGLVHNPRNSPTHLRQMHGLEYARLYVLTETLYEGNVETHELALESARACIRGSSRWCEMELWPKGMLVTAMRPSHGDYDVGLLCSGYLDDKYLHHASPSNYFMTADDPSWDALIANLTPLPDAQTLRAWGEEHGVTLPPMLGQL